MSDEPKTPKLTEESPVSTHHQTTIDGEVIKYTVTVGRTPLKNEQGEILPRKIINRFECTLNGKQVFAVDLHTAVSSNPYLVFSVRVTESGTFEFAWTDDDGTVYKKTAKIQVS